METMTMARAVAKELGEGWSVADGAIQESAYLAGPDDAQLFIRHGGYQLQGRISIHATAAPELLRQLASWRSDEKLPTITVADTTAPAKIAREIQRRLLPGYWPLLATLRERKTSNDDYNNRRETLAAQLCSLIPGSSRPAHLNTDQGSRVYLPHKAGYGTIDVSGSGAKFELNVGPEVAVELAKLIARLSA